MKTATRIMIATFGGFVGLMGIEHGLGEVLQGNTAPNGLVFPSWPDSQFFAVLDGEPAMSVIPNLFITGILAIIVSLFYFIWATMLVQRKHSSMVLILASILMLTVGGGIFTPILGILIAAAATKISAPVTRWQKRLPAGPRHLLETLWPWFFGACIFSWLLMFPGVPVLNYFFGFYDANLIFIVLACMFAFLFLASIAGFVRDSQDPAGSSWGI